jgi:hypothetical protein
MSASLVIGQPDFTSSTAATSASALSQPYDVSFDSKGNLYVADYSNSRTMVFSAPFSNGMSATGVLGEPDMNTSTGGTSGTTLSYPNGATAIP